MTSDGEFHEVALPTDGAMASVITLGADGTLWFTLNQANAIGQFVVGAEPVIHPLPTQNAGPVGVTATREAIWFVEILAGQVGRITPDGKIIEHPLPDRNARPHAIVADAEGDGCWFTEWGINRLAHIDGAGDVREIELPDSSEPHGLTIDTDGVIWVALESGALARVAKRSTP